MGALLFFSIFMGALGLADAMPYIAWATITLAKYTLYRTLRLGKMPMREYFKHYYKMTNLAER